MILSWQEKSASIARWSAVLLGFSIPISVALDNVLLLLILALWLLGGRYRDKISIIRANPVALLSLALYGFFLVASLYGDRYEGDTQHYLGKYIDLLFVPIFITLFQDAKTRRYALLSFTFSIVLVLLLSYAIAAGMKIPGTHYMSGAANPVVFKLHITHGILMAFGAFLFAAYALHDALNEGNRCKQMLFALLAVLAVYNVVFMVQGRTGYILLALLLVYFCYCALRWKGLAVAAVLGAALFSAAFVFSPGFNSRITQAISEFSAWDASSPTSATSSTGQRLEFYQHSLNIVAQHPLLGVGTGGFPKAYADEAQKSGIAATHNPHNEYLLIAVQLGLLGAGLLVYLFVRQWQLAARLPAPLETQLARALVITFAAGCLLNSLLVDHVEGLFFAWMSGLLFAGFGRAGSTRHGLQRRVEPALREIS